MVSFDSKFKKHTQNFITLYKICNLWLWLKSSYIVCYRKKAKQLKKSLTEKADLLAEKQEDYDAFKQKKDKIIEDLENKLNFTLSNEVGSFRISMYLKKA